MLATGSNPLPAAELDDDAHVQRLSRLTSGSTEIQVTVNDGKAAAKKAEFTLTVALPPNRPPNAPEVSSQTATVAFSYVVPEFDDPDGDTVTYCCTVDGETSLPGWLSFNASPDR